MGRVWAWKCLVPSGCLVLRASWPCAHSWGQFVGTAAALLAGGDRETSLAFVFFFLFFFLVPNDAGSRQSSGDPFSCFPTVIPLVVVVAVGTSALMSFFAFSVDFLFFLFACFPTVTGPWRADSWRRSEADTAASRHRCHSSSLSSLLRGGGGLGQLSWEGAPRLLSPLALSLSHQKEARRRQLQSSVLGVGPTQVPTPASLLPNWVTSLTDLTFLTLSLFIYKMGILTKSRTHRNIPRSDMSGTRWVLRNQ